MDPQSVAGTGGAPFQGGSPDSGEEDTTTAILYIVLGFRHPCTVSLAPPAGLVGPPISWISAVHIMCVFFYQGLEGRGQ
ncbi:TPA: hypothetical protein GDO54_018489 [Pyxicephalus adspersus]|uniref:Uncharacterized protein n=1 Tax=Pyxicephalus adspersus TaxID=30357 RepID=A0AAV2ZDE8_PYXAD|nr:TPA: hypothetical protein GDO54_018489 [Pyxicephalus adspersus]